MWAPLRPSWSRLPSNEWPSRADHVSATVDEILSEGTIAIEARFTNSSNNTMLVTVSLGEEELLAVYKPEEGERPLWDFPEGLWRREIAAYELSEALGLGIVPETIARLEGPFGPGSLQRYVPEDGEHHYFTVRDEPTYRSTFQAIAAFDVVANNSDRKSGHVLQEGTTLWCIDHGLCFHEEEKLRTVIWDFAGDPISPELLERLAALREAPPTALTALLSAGEIAAIVARTDALLAAGTLPFPDEDGPYPPYPWPLV